MINVSELTLLDLSAAFDTTHHDKLIGHLESDLGITDNALAWFKSYLSDCFQCVSVNCSLSDQFPLKQGVPHGSCLGLSTHANCSRSLNATSHKSTATRTTHSCRYHSARANQSADADFTIKSMTDCISDIRSWIISDNLMLGTRQQLAKVNINCIRVGSADVCDTAFTVYGSSANALELSSKRTSCYY